MESMHEPVAVLGIGAMGHGMATSALRAGIRTIVWNRNPAATRDLAALGAAGTTSNLELDSKHALIDDHRAMTAPGEYQQRLAALSDCVDGT